MLDFLVQLVPFLPDQNTASELLKLVTTTEVLQNKDTAVQKKAYRALVRMCESNNAVGERCIRDNIEQVVEELIEKNHNVAASAKKDRIVLLATIIPILPADKLHVIPSIIPEAVLSTKEANEATRAAAYDLLVGMAEKMAKGGVIKRDLIRGAQDMQEDEEDAEPVQNEAEASIQEYITMVAAGLVGTSPHMISATITALSRLLFEYHGKLGNLSCVFKYRVADPSLQNNYHPLPLTTCSRLCSSSLARQIERLSSLPSVSSRLPLSDWLLSMYNPISQSLCLLSSTGHTSMPTTSRLTFDTSLSE